MDKKNRFFEVCLAMAYKRKAVAIDTYDGMEKASEIEAIYADDTVVLGEMVHAEVHIMNIIRFEDTTSSPGG